MARLYALNEAPELGLFSSIKAAARAVGVDPANLSKTVTGSRRTAGGFSLSTVSESEISTGALGQDVLQADIAEARAAHAVFGMSQRQQEQRAARRAQNAAAAAAQRRRAKSTPELRALRKQAHDLMVMANDIIRQSKKKKTHISKELAADMKRIAAAAGTGKRAAFNTSAGSISGKPAPQLQGIINNIIQSLDAEQQRKAERRAKNRQIEMQKYGMTSPEEVKKYEDAMESFYNALEQLKGIFPRIDGSSEYDFIFHEMQKDMKRATPEDVEKLAQILSDFVDRKKDRTSAELHAIYEKWQCEALGIKPKEKPPEEYTDYLEQMINNESGWSWDD